MRSLLLASFLCVTGMMAVSPASGAEPTAKKSDPWTGTYTKFNRGPHGDVQQVKITITKEADGYHLSKPYDTRTFTEREKGVLSDGKGGLGKIFFGSAAFADGVRTRILRADFCYEGFILYDGWGDHTPTAPEK